MKEKLGVEDGIGLKNLHGPALVFQCLCVSVYGVWGGGGHFIGGQQVGGPPMKLVLWSLGCAPVLFSVPGDSVYLRPHGTCFKLT